MEESILIGAAVAAVAVLVFLGVPKIRRKAETEEAPKVFGEITMAALHAERTVIADLRARETQALAAAAAATADRQAAEAAYARLQAQVATTSP